MYVLGVTQDVLLMFSDIKTEDVCTENDYDIMSITLSERPSCILDTL
jgi:hypothetical protein